MKKSELFVQPVKKYKKPRYPGWKDPNPLEHPGAEPFPFSKKVLVFLTAAGLAGAAFSGCTGKGGGNENDPNQAPSDSLRNVFTFEKNGLPYQSAFFGTGQPLSINHRFALKVLENLAREEGFQVQTGHVFESKGVKMTLDGWDAQHRTGYVFLRWDNTGEGFNWWGSLLSFDELDSKGNLQRRRRFHNWSEAWDFYDGKFPGRATEESESSSTEALRLAIERQLAEEFPGIEDRVRRKLAYFKTIIPSIKFIESEYNSRMDDVIDRHYFPRLEKLLNELSRSPDPQKQLELYEDFDKARLILHEISTYKNAEKYWVSIFSTPDRTVRQQKIRQWNDLLQWAHKDAATLDIYQKALAQGKKDPLEIFAAELENFDRATASLAELQELDRLAASGEAFIMPVSAQDKRLLYHQWDFPKTWGGPFSDADAPPELLDSLEGYQKKQQTLPDSLRSVHNKNLRDKNMLDALSELERQARYYLRWAKMQGL